MRKRQKGGAAAAACQLRSGVAHPFTDLRGFVPLGTGEERIYRQVRDRETGQQTARELIWDNHSQVLFDPALIPAELLREE